MLNAMYRSNFNANKESTATNEYPIDISSDDSEADDSTPGMCFYSISLEIDLVCNVRISIQSQTHHKDLPNHSNGQFRLKMNWTMHLLSVN